MYYSKTNPEERLQARLFILLKAQSLASIEVNKPFLEKLYKKGLDLTHEKSQFQIMESINQNTWTEDAFEWLVERKFTPSILLEEKKSKNLIFFLNHPWHWLTQELLINKNPMSLDILSRKINLFSQLIPTDFKNEEGEAFWHYFVSKINPPIHFKKFMNEVTPTQINFLRDQGFSLYQRNHKGDMPIHDGIKVKDWTLVNVFLKSEPLMWTWMNGKGKTVFKLIDEQKKSISSIENIEILAALESHHFKKVIPHEEPDCTTPQNKKAHRFI